MTFDQYFDSEWLPLGNYFSHHRKRFLQTWEFLRETVDREEGTVLDVGGVGPIASYLAAHGWQVSESKEDLRGDLSFDSEKFDLILCTETIEHIKDIDSCEIADLEAFNYSGVNNMLLELTRTLRTNGHILITTPNACSLLTLSKWLHGQVLLMDPGHVREFTCDELIRVCRSTGLVSVSTRVVNSWTPDPLLTPDIVRQLISLHPNFKSVCHDDNILALFRRNAAT